MIEQSLCSDGYEIVAPEALSLNEQVAHMQDAEVLLFAESSALHLFALVQRLGQRVGVIQRRRMLPMLIGKQLEDGPAEVHPIEAIADIYWPPLRQDNVSIARLDFDKLRSQLIRGGFLSSTASWRIPTADEVTASLHAGLKPGTQLLPDEQRGAWLRARRQRTMK